MIEEPDAKKSNARTRLLRTRLRKLARLAREPRYWPALRHGVAASVEHSGVPFRPDVRTVIDVGASRGQFALFARRRFPGARIVCFEPLPAPFDRLTEVLGGQVEAHRLAIGSEPGREEMTVSASDDSSSLLPIGERQVREFPGTGAAGTQAVEVETLDGALPGEPARPALLKIDVQGLELEVLKGASRTLGSVDECFVECSFVELYEGQAMADEVVGFLEDRGFRLDGVHGVVRSADGEPLQGDFLFRRVDV